MLIALGPRDYRMQASPFARALCPSCRGPVLAKCGDLVTWHWAHITNVECDDWWEESEWHRGWKALAPPSCVEVVMGRHRADIVGRQGVVELQRRYLSPDDVRAREQHYGRTMIWLFEAVSCADRIDLRPNDGYVTFRWKHARTSVAYAERPVFLDLGPHILQLKKIHPEAPVGGWGYLVTREYFIRTYLQQGKA